jgi:hypothetical protein
MRFTIRRPEWAYVFDDGSTGRRKNSAVARQIWTAILLNHSIKIYGIMEKD